MDRKFSKLNELISDAYKLECVENDFEGAEKLYIEALKFEEAHSHYCYGKFLESRGRLEEAEKHLAGAYNAGYPPAIVYTLLKHIDQEGEDTVDEGLLEQVELAAGKGHLVAQVFLIEHKMRNSPTIFAAMRLALKHMNVSRKVKRIENDERASQEPIWF